MTKALTITPKVSQTYNTVKTKAAKTLPVAANYVTENKPSKATRGIVGTVIDIFKAIAKKISSPENAVSQISKNTNLPSHKDPAAIVIKTMHG